MKNIINKIRARHEPHIGRAGNAVAKRATPSVRDPAAYAEALKILG